MFGKWLKRRDTQESGYVRAESPEIKAFYKPYADFYERTPDDIAAVVERLSQATALPRISADYPVSADAIKSAADAFAAVVRSEYRLEIDWENPDPTQMDRVADHLIDAQLRPYFCDGKLRDDLSESDGEQYFKAREAIRIPNEPLLYYAMGAFYCEWLVAHRQAALCLYAPLNPVQSFPDMITAGHTVCLHPFSQVTKRLSDPEGDNLQYKCTPAMRARYIPPYPLLVSLADADQAVQQLLPAKGRQAMQADEHNDQKQAFSLYAQAIAEDPNNLQLLSMGSACALRVEQYDAAADWMELLLSIKPDSPVTNHNLALLYASIPERAPEAIQLLEKAIETDPRYARAHLTLASVLVDIGRRDAAIAHLNWIIENDQDLKDDATRFLGEIQGS